jgi:HEAT repeat protein
MDDAELHALLIEYMGKGFLENIIALMKQDPPTARFIPAMLSSEALVVRLGTTALVEELAKGHQHILSAAVPGLLELLNDANATVRGDAANALGIIGDRSAVGRLRVLEEDANPVVREIAREAVQEIEASGS